jgi:hypothetical protein
MRLERSNGGRKLYPIGNLSASRDPEGARGEWSPNPGLQKPGLTTGNVGPQCGPSHLAQDSQPLPRRSPLVCLLEGWTRIDNAIFGGSGDRRLS